MNARTAKNTWLSLVWLSLLLATACSSPLVQPQADAPLEVPSASPTQESVFGITPAFSATLPPALPTVPAPPPEPSPTLAPSPAPLPALAAGAPLTLLSIDMFDQERGWGEAQLAGASGWRLARTDDGGRTWLAADLPGGYPMYSKYYALDMQTLWAAPAQPDPALVGAGVQIYRSQDGGLSWQASQPLSLQTSEGALAENFIPSALFFLDSSTGWLAASIGHYMHQDVIVIYQTLDGGLTWQALTDKFQAGQSGGAGLPCQALGLAFTSLQRGWLAGNCLAVSLDERWKVLETNDGGRTWQYRDLQQPAEAPANVLSSQAACGPDGLKLQPGVLLTLDFRCIDYSAPGNTPVFNFTYTSTDAGETWQAAQVSGVSYASADFGIGLGPLSQAGQRSLLVSRDRGASWQATFPVAWPEAWLDFTDPQNGWAIARRANNESGGYDYALVRTRDGGGIWELIQPTAR